MVRTKLVPKRVRQWQPKKFKIKTLSPEQKTINIKKKNGQVIKTMTVRRKFLKNACTKLERSRY